MPIDTTPSTVATNALQAIPFGTLIGAPLDACIRAQVTAAKSTCDFINSVGFDANGKPKSVVFEYQRDGKIVSIIVPVLTIVPIPYIQIDTITIDFMANISASASTVTENSEASNMGGELSVSARVGWGPFSVSADFKANYSSKKESKATAESKYSVEYTMNVHVGASQSSMPAGLAAVLNILQGSITGSEPGGEITISPRTSTMANRNQAAYFEITVKDSKGLLVPNQEVKISLQQAQGGLVLKNLGIAPGDPVGASTPISATAKTNDAGIVGVTVEIDPRSGESPQNILKLGTSTILKASDGAAQPPKTASAQLMVLPQSALPPTVAPDSIAGLVGDKPKIEATLLDAAGKPWPGKLLTAKSGDSRVATINSPQTTGPEGKATFDVTLAGAGTTNVEIANESTSVPVAVSVTQPATGFELKADPFTLSIQAGQNKTSTITSTVFGGFNSAVNLTASGQPSGVTVAFDKTTLPAPGSGSAVMTVTVAAGTAAGTHDITVTGTGASITSKTTVQVQTTV